MTADPADGEVLRFAPFSALGGREVYDLLALRAAVFVVEQRCVYLDPDGADPEAVHLLATRAGALVGTLRVLFPAGAPPRIGRVVVAPGARGSGLGRRMTSAAIAWLEDARPGAAIALSAQAHLSAFYAAFGFRETGPVHGEDGIPHVEMVRAPR